MSEFSISGRAAIVGLGATEFSKNSGRTEVRLAMEATLQALNDAGIDPSEVDGFSSYSVDKVPEYEIARLLGAKNINFFGCCHRHCQNCGGLPRHERAQLVSLWQWQLWFRILTSF
jgi:acetyl-CoA acetyltransferase